MLKLSDRFISASREYTTNTHTVPAPYLRRAFYLPQMPEAASVTICGLGFYDLTVNGHRVTKGHMAPYISNPDDILYYDAYNIAEYLQKGENVLGITLGNGFLNGWGGYVWDFHQTVFRSAPKAAVYAEITVGSDTLTIEADEQFLCHPSPILWDDLRAGECYDARNQLPGWDLPGYDTAGWTPAIPADTPRGEKRICEAEPIVAVCERRPVAITREGDAYIYDFGQNDAGVSRLTISGEPGQTVTLHHGELLVDGKFYNDNLVFRYPRHADQPQFSQRVVYTCKGEGVETYQPSFCYMGYRYIKVEGITEAQATPELLTYVGMHSDLRERGGFSCSDPILNKLQQMTRTATTSNFWYFPTDCPHREKNGWTADASLSAEHTLLNLTAENSYREWLRNICKAQNDRGELPGIVPTGGWGFAWGNGPAWDHVLVNLPYMIYKLRGELDAARECAPAILRYVHYITTRTRPDGLIAIGLGDWCAPHGRPHSPLELTDSVMCYDICTKAAALFDALAMRPQRNFCQSVADGFRNAVRANLVDFSTMTVAGSCQTSQALAIYYGILTPAESVTAFRVLVELIHRQNDHLDTGVLGARVLFHLLSDYGETELAYRVLTAEGHPSYGEWARGDDTCLPEGFHSGGLASHNHHFWGDISHWFIRCIGGIRLNPTGRDVSQLEIAPSFPDALEHAEAFHRAPLGEIRTAWVRENDRVRLTVTVPEGMTGTLRLPKDWRLDNGFAWMPITSGEYVCVRA